MLTLKSLKGRRKPIKENMHWWRGTTHSSCFFAYPLVFLRGSHPQSSRGPTVVKAWSKLPSPIKAKAISSVSWSIHTDELSLVASQTLCWMSSIATNYVNKINKWTKMGAQGKLNLALMSLLKYVRQSSKPPINNEFLHQTPWAPFPKTLIKKKRLNENGILVLPWRKK